MNFVSSNFNRTYNPSGKQNALSDIKRLLTSRDTEAQSKACGYLIEVISKYSEKSNESVKLVDYLLDNDITVFLCEATSNLDFSLFRLILSCLRLLCRERRFYAESHAAHAAHAALRALQHYAAGGLGAPVDACLHFLCDLLDGVRTHETTPPLSNQSAYSAVQLLACLNSLATHISTNQNIVLSSALVLHSLIAYQPDSLAINGGTATMLVEVLNKWLGLLMGALNHTMLVGDESSGMFLVVTCQMGINVLRLIKLLRHGTMKVDFVQAILTDDQEIGLLKQCATEMSKSIHRVMSELVTFAKENLNSITTEEYRVYLKFLLNFLHENGNCEFIFDFCDVLFAKGYLTMLPQAQIVRNDSTIRKLSILILGEMLKVLAEKYLNVSTDDVNNGIYAKDIHMGLVELQYGIEQPQCIGTQLQKNQPYSLLIYIYFLCQSSENPEEATAPLFPYLVEHILTLPKTFTPPPYIIKALWLVFAMSTISSPCPPTLEQRVYLEKATSRLVGFLQPPAVFYSHHPALLLWAFTSQRIPNHVRLEVLSLWLKIEDSIPEDIANEPSVWELLLNVLTQNKHDKIVTNCMEALHNALENGSEDARQEFGTLVWTSLPCALSKVLIDFDTGMAGNVKYILDIATTTIPLEIDETTCVKISVLITTMFTKYNPEHFDGLESQHHFEYVCLKLSLYLLGLAFNQNESGVLLTYTSRAGFLSRVLRASSSADDKVACAALQLLSYVVHYYAKNNYKPHSIVEVQTDLLIKSLRNNGSTERGVSLLQFVYMVLNSGRGTPLVLSYDFGDQCDGNQQCNALRALMFRIQMMLCSSESSNQSSAGWKTLCTIFKHAIVTKNDPKLIATLTAQPWTHSLILFQLTLNISEEFLTFTHNWITLLKVTLEKNAEGRRYRLSKYSLIVKTLKALKKYLAKCELKDLSEKVLAVVEDIFKASSVNFG